MLARRAPGTELLCGAEEGRPRTSHRPLGAMARDPNRGGDTGEAREPARGSRELGTTRGQARSVFGQEV